MSNIFAPSFYRLLLDSASAIRENSQLFTLQIVITKTVCLLVNII